MKDSRLDRTDFRTGEQGKGDAKLPKFETWEVAIDAELAYIKRILVMEHHMYGLENIMALGETGIMVGASDKLGRLKHLKAGQLHELANIDEQVDCLWVELALYAVIALMLRHGTFELPLDLEKETLIVCPPLAPRIHKDGV